jgi:hypothetical protein
VNLNVDLEVNASVGLYTVSSVSNELTNLSRLRRTTSGTRIEIR